MHDPINRGWSGGCAEVVLAVEVKSSSFMRCIAGISWQRCSVCFDGGRQAVMVKC